MFSLSESNKFCMYNKGVDMRKGINGLSGEVSRCGRTAHDGNVYVFANESRTIMKLLHWERGGFVVYQKRFEAGRVSKTVFKGSGVAGFSPLRWDEVVLLVEGMNPNQRRRKRYNIFDGKGV